MIRNEGSFWRDMRYVGVPGVDNLNQIGPGIVADFPKIAGSAAHRHRPSPGLVRGRRRHRPGRKVRRRLPARARHQLHEYPRPHDLRRRRSVAIGWYVSRAQHLLAIGRPAAQVAYLSSHRQHVDGRQGIRHVTLKLVTELLEHQIDFDHIDADELAARL